MDLQSPSVWIESLNLPTYSVTPRSALPPILDAEGMYPYQGYISTSRQPSKRVYQSVVIDNGVLKVTVLPELGGRIYQIEDSQTGAVYLHANEVVRPVRIPPVGAYLGMGIELNFPSTHSPTGFSPVGYEMLHGDDGSVGVAVGEREMRFGLCWRAEIKLYPGFRGVCIAVRGWNPTEKGQNVQWWSNTAQPAGGDVEFVYPYEPVLAHVVGEEDGHWPEFHGIDLRWHRQYDHMCGLFWHPTKEDYFGAFHHERGWGMLHLADPAKLPGKKLWTFGFTGDNCDWTLGMTREGGPSCEIQSGVPPTQSQFLRLEPGGDFDFIEFWVPVDAREQLDDERRPSFTTVVESIGGVEAVQGALKEIPSPSGQLWKSLMKAHAENDLHWLGDNAVQFVGTWPPTGLDLTSALRWAVDAEGGDWRYQLALNLCATEHWGEAADLLQVLSEEGHIESLAMLGLVLWKIEKRPEDAWNNLRKAVSLLPDGRLLAEADALLGELGRHDERLRLQELFPEGDFRKTEALAAIALSMGDPQRAIDILEGHNWERHHARMHRTRMWQEARTQLGLPTEPVSQSLKEDILVFDK